MIGRKSGSERVVEIGGQSGIDAPKVIDVRSGKAQKGCRLHACRSDAESDGRFARNRTSGEKGHGRNEDRKKGTNLRCSST